MPGPIPWRSLDPPIPPMNANAFRGRFVALHAAAVHHPDLGAVVIAGDKGAGKTTVSVGMVNEHGCALYTDELTHIHRRTAIVEPFPRSVGIADAYDRATGAPPVKRARPAPEVCDTIAAHPGRVTHLVFMHPDPAQDAPSLRQISRSSALRWLMHHQLDVDTDPDEAILTLTALARGTRAFECHYHGYKQLRTVPAALSTITPVVG